MLETPPMRRRVVQPLRQLGLFMLLAAAPVAALIVQPDERSVRTVLHVAVTFTVLLLAFRVLGKRELSRLSPFELVTLMLIPEILSNSVQGEGGLGASLVGLSTVLALVLAVSLVSQRFPSMQPILESSPTVLVLDGVLLEKSMNQERIPPDELMSEMRKQGLERLEDVHLAVLESSGNITFVARNREPHPSNEAEGPSASG